MGIERRKASASGLRQLFQKQLDHLSSLLCPRFGHLQNIVGLSASVGDTGGRGVSPVPVGGDHHDPAGAFGRARALNYRYPVLTREFTVFLEEV